MATSIKQLNKWANAHTSFPLDFARIVLGVFLFFKGAVFITDKQYLSEILSSFRGGFGSEIFIVHYVAFAHMLGGFMIILGFFTRWSIWFQLPIVLCAMLINFIGEFDLSNFIQSSVALLLCVFFAFYGSGKHSLDYSFKMEL
jgi:putative oxidoreductase